MKRLFMLSLAAVLVLSGCSNDSGSSNTYEENVHYTNCDDVRANNADPIYEGDPGFQSKFDRDGDGVGCEKF